VADKDYMVTTPAQGPVVQLVRLGLAVIATLLGMQEAQAMVAEPLKWVMVGLALVVVGPVVPARPEVVVGAVELLSSPTLNGYQLQTMEVGR
jgi:hypothetical protein